jgi:hypothetical protein
MGDGSLLTQVVLVLGASVSLISVNFVRGVLLLHGSTRSRTAPHCGVFSVFLIGGGAFGFRWGVDEVGYSGDPRLSAWGRR